MYLTNKVIIVENFYKDPDMVRNLALNQEFLPESHPERFGNWPGRRSKFINDINPRLCEEFRDSLMHSLLEGVPTNYNCYFETNFQLCYETDGDSWIHYDFDPKDWEITHVGVVYLNPNPPPNSGTLIYDFNKEYEQEFLEYSEKHNHIWRKLNRDQDSKEFNRWWTLNLSVENKYNRAVLYSPSVWHKSDRYFGNDKDSGRLIQPFFCNIKYSS
jgi:hypothetical protein